jgi:feruloyl esterase
VLTAFLPVRVAFLLQLVLIVAALPVLSAAAQTPDTGPSGATPRMSGAAVSCAELAATDFSALPGASVRIASAEEVAATGGDPAHCRVEGAVAANARFVVQLPRDGWDGRYFQSGCGGYCGSLNPNADCRTAFAQGGAIGYSDLGTTGMDDPSWTLDEGARRDFAYAANHELAVAAKAIAAAYYGQPPAHSYFIGCSDGGREALMEAQRFPDDFDGIVAGAPAYLLAFLNSFKHTWQYRANTDAAGSPIVTAEKAAVLHAAVIAACDARDGVEDGLLFDPRDCAFDPAALLCPNDADAPDCLTQAQVDAAKRLYAAPIDANGVRYYPAATLPYGSELRWAGGGPPGGGSFDKTIADVYLGSLSLPLPWQDADWSADALAFRPRDFFALLPMAAVYDASDPDLSAFRDRGGKLILYHGWADDSISPEGTIAYYDALQREMGGPEATRTFARLFMFPGVYHCSGGEGPSHFDMVGPITDWVERGLAPERIVASQYEGDAATAGGGFENPTDVQQAPGGTPAAAGSTPAASAQRPGGTSNDAPSGAVVRPLPAFPYPLRPRYAGSGDVNDAANYAPVLPDTPTDDAIDWIGTDFVSGSSR